jgi:hypothetical protein
MTFGKHEARANGWVQCMCRQALDTTNRDRGTIPRDRFAAHVAACPCAKRSVASSFSGDLAVSLA